MNNKLQYCMKCNEVFSMCCCDFRKPDGFSIEQIDQYLSSPRPLPIATATVCMQQLADVMQEKERLLSVITEAVEARGDQGAVLEPLMNYLAQRNKDSI